MGAAGQPGLWSPVATIQPWASGRLLAAGLLFLELPPLLGLALWGRGRCFRQSYSPLAPDGSSGRG